MRVLRGAAPASHCREAQCLALLIAMLRFVWTRIFVAAVVAVVHTAPGSATTTGFVTIDSAAILGSAIHRASGLLHGLTAAAPPTASDASVLAPLHLRAYRGSMNPDRSDGAVRRLAAMNATVFHLIAGDAYREMVSGSVMPGDIPGNFTAWEQLLRSTYAHWVASGMPAVAVDVWNEPDGFLQRNQSQFYAIHAHATRVLRSLKPAPEIVAPSLSRYDPGGGCDACTYGPTWLKDFLLGAQKNDVLPDGAIHCTRFSRHDSTQCLLTICAGIASNVRLRMH